MKVLVVFLVVAASAAAVSAAATSCAPTEEFFSRHNISADDRNVPGAGYRKQQVFSYSELVGKTAYYRIFYEKLKLFGSFFAFSTFF